MRSTRTEVQNVILDKDAVVLSTVQNYGRQIRKVSSVGYDALGVRARELVNRTRSAGGAMAYHHPVRT